MTHESIVKPPELLLHAQGPVQWDTVPDQALEPESAALGLSPGVYAD